MNPSPPRARRPLAWLAVPAALTVLSMLPAHSALAQQSPWYLRLSQGFYHESNVWGLADDAFVPAGISRGDNISDTAVVAGLDQPIGRQRVYADLQAHAYRYQNNDELNNQGYRLGAGLDWSTAERLAGTLRLGYSDRLARFSGVGAIQIPVAARNRETLKLVDGTITLGQSTQWRGEAGFGWRQLRYSEPLYYSSDNDQEYLSAGVRYRPGGSTTLGLGVRRTHGEYPRRYLDAATGTRVAEVYDRDDIYLDAEYAPGGASRVYANLFFGNTEYETFNARDFRGITGAIGWNWTPTGKITVETRLSQDTGVDGYLYDAGAASYGISDNSRTTTALRVNASYQFSAKVRAYAGASYAKRDLVNTLFAPDGSQTTLSGSNYPWTFNIGASWAPTHWAVLNCTASRQSYEAVPGLERAFSASTVGCSAQLLLR